jgi:hypothetical protein
MKSPNINSQYYLWRLACSRFAQLHRGVTLQPDGGYAGEVAEVDPNLVARDKDGRPYSVRYDQVNVMLLNEFLKEHKRVEEQSTIIAQQRKDSIEQQRQIQTLASSLQKVTEELELIKPQPRMLANSR